MSTLSRRDLLERTACLASGAMASTLAGIANPRRHNVIVLKSDEHNPMVSSVMGHPAVRTPNMERLARMGTVYENAYCVSPLCMPSRSAYVSGRYAHEIQAYSNCSVFSAKYPTYASVLAEQGVHTVHIGKTDFNMPEANAGFTELTRGGDREKPGDTNISRHPLAIRTDAARRADGWGVPKDGSNPHTYDEQTVEVAINWLQTHANSMNSPWTLEVNTGSPHFPHFVTRDEWQMYPDGGDLPRLGRDEESARHPIAMDLRRHFETDLFSEANMRGLRRGYLGCVTFVDRQIGRLLDVYEKLGLATNTVIAYTSDHGDMLGKFGLWWKCSLYEDSARVPLLVAGPGFRQGARVATPVSQLDLQASLFRATRSRRPKSWYGKPLQEIALNDPNRVVFAEYHGHGARCSSYLIRRNNWKLIYHTEAPHQLFDLKNDPDERRNRAETEPEVMQELSSELRRICDPQAENARAEAVIRRQLKAIGSAT